MAETTTGLTVGGQPVSEALATAWSRTQAAVPAGKVGAASATVTLQGVEAGVAWQPRTGLWLTGYAGRMWGGGGWTAGARATFVW